MQDERGSVVKTIEHVNPIHPLGPLRARACSLVKGRATIDTSHPEKRTCSLSTPYRLHSHCRRTGLTLALRGQWNVITLHAIKAPVT